MSHAFIWLPAHFHCATLAFFSLGAGYFMGILKEQGGPLKTDETPYGVLSFEFAWNQDRAEKMIASWRTAGVAEVADRQIRIDFGFLIFYPLCFSLACAMLSASPSNTMPTVGAILSWAILAAIALDASENFALLRMLHDGASTALAQTATWCASVKFLLILAVLGYLIVQGITIVWSKFGG